MAWSRRIAWAVSSSPLLFLANANYVWPNSRIDELEKLGALGIGRSFGAEWITNAYHDMSTPDIFAGTGGLDASIVFEMDRLENVGDAFRETLNILKGSHNNRVSMSDLFTLATVVAVGGCSKGKVIVPLKGGRVDAAGPGLSGVPELQQHLQTHTANFAKQPFDTSEMIALVACGHTVGGVHGVDLPEIVPNPAPTDGSKNDITLTFDTTTDDFDNIVAKEFIANVSRNPLAFGQIETTRSDFRIFNADGGDMISQIATFNDFFLDTCSTMFERMVSTVPRNAQLRDIKPLLRIGVDTRIASHPQKIPTECGISSFTVEIADSQTGKTSVHDTGRAGFSPPKEILAMYFLSRQSVITVGGVSQMQLNLTVAKVDGTNYTLYTGIWQRTSAASTHSFDIVAVGPDRTVSSLFDSWDDVPRE
ncbi:heme peroxidase [Trichoderma citrinoviride]|uniref:Peroxidase n=1 Tax=Trichoderma citrinoviride TaxID=58853 RepID=A0A2T4AYQ0_9HYPO|nr:heme peroxidase [Trichoderma citrinoviride]PTB62108.1 heme peroxidase [Trichoderma citrinoviride]